jgi:hypothetical protein
MIPLNIWTDLYRKTKSRHRFARDGFFIGKPFLEQLIVLPDHRFARPAIIDFSSISFSNAGSNTDA